MKNNIKKPLVIFEIANNHMGNFKHAKKIISECLKLKKNFSKKIDFALKFQFRDLDTYIHKSYKNTDHSQVNRFESTKFSDYEWISLINYAKKDFKLICTPFDEISVNKVLKFKFDIIKIPSCSMNEWPFLEYFSKKIKKKKLFVA
ncbi:N-acetylneuraminate synthase family protein [Candidatus Pelagibacter bacterium nBUS_30]|uniref:N-acetylneuraminate synthase family protein n=1 Tax=Candidatus Pelagibacter bacterium nBUS_30 TaxID=3374191 RepID=UPI003EBF4E41